MSIRTRADSLERMAMRRVEEKTCLLCGRPFIGIRKRIYCSMACNQKAYWRRKHVLERRRYYAGLEAKYRTVVQQREQHKWTFQAIADHWGWRQSTHAYRTYVRAKKFLAGQGRRQLDMPERSATMP